MPRPLQALAAAVSSLVGAVSPAALQQLRDMLAEYQSAAMSFEGAAQRLGPMPLAKAKQEVGLCISTAASCFPTCPLVRRLRACQGQLEQVAQWTTGTPDRQCGKPQLHAVRRTKPLACHYLIWWSSQPHMVRGPSHPLGKS